MTALLVFLGGAIGAPLRYAVDRALPRGRDGFPWGILAANTLGCLILGALLGSLPLWAPGFVAFATTGICGALTTYSTFGLHTVRLWRRGRRRDAVANVVLTVGCGFAALLLGELVAQTIW